MGNMCCMESSIQRKCKFISQNEREALLESAKSSKVTDVCEKGRDLQIKMENEGVSVEDSAHEKSFFQQISTEDTVVVGSKRNEFLTVVHQEESDRQQTLCTEQETVIASELALGPPQVEQADLQDNPKSLAFENRADLESEKGGFLTNTQQVVIESGFQEPAYTLRQTSVVCKPATVLERNVSIEDQNTAFHMLKDNGCNVFGKSELGEQCTYMSVQQVVKNDVSPGPLNSMLHEEDESHQLPEPAGVTCHSVLKPSVMTTKRVRLSENCDHRDSQADCDHLAEGAKDLMQMVDLHGDESEATNLENKQSDPGMEVAFCDQQSEDQFPTDEKAAEDFCDKSKFQDRVFDARNEKTAPEPEDMDNGSVVEDEDLYRDENEIEEEKSKIILAHENQITAARDPSSLEPSVVILEYCAREWKSSTTKAQLMKKAYNTVHETFSSVRRVRGDNYCALRATLFQALSNIELPKWIQKDTFLQFPEKLITENYSWIKQWNFGAQIYGNEDPVEKLKEYLILLKCKWTDVCGMASLEERQSACEKIFSGEIEEYSLFEALKFLMLVKAIELDRDKLQEKEVPLFCWLLFARDTSDNPYLFMKNHLNHVGYTGGLDQVEMFLLGYTMQLTIRVFRLYKFGTDEFITFYPDDHQEDWPVITLITEDDRHYNVLVGESEVSEL
ncbi:uncharacterized protein LOC103183941 isoform X2 [Callorhinchus milii]|uniref:uncharacterized protein LOC103183941 isoform X2 n=1 Tax=Callorhinchus milii TaxID=7868 RepID=UPI0004574C0F|nr:uncharacterized protein LOC103183941 isoform X2 [Callorhinchus milii]|eukprot:gi/632967295/ref/XP_007899898.1/ PREDICTED: uncharacterized protein LOC103183941 isoform X2 [Callorhinchus milii]